MTGNITTQSAPVEHAAPAEGDGRPAVETFYFSKAELGFFSSSVHGSALPVDATPISADLHRELLYGQCAGMVIVADDDGMPVLVEPPPPSAGEALKSQILLLEASITPRRMREAALGIDGGWLAGIDQQIAALRSQLP